MDNNIRFKLDPNPELSAPVSQIISLIQLGLYATLFIGISHLVILGVYIIFKKNNTRYKKSFKRMLIFWAIFLTSLFFGVYVIGVFLGADFISFRGFPRL